MLKRRITALNCLLSLMPLVFASGVPQDANAAWVRIGAVAEAAPDGGLIRVAKPSHRPDSNGDGANNAGGGDQDANDPRRILREAEDALQSQAENLRQRFQQELARFENDLTLRQMHRNALQSQIDMAQQERAGVGARAASEIDRRLEALRTNLSSLDQDIAELQGADDFRQLRIEHARQFARTQRAIERIRTMRAELTRDGRNKQLRGVLSPRFLMSSMQSARVKLTTQISAMERSRRTDPNKLAEAKEKIRQIETDIGVMNSNLGAAGNGLADDASQDGVNLMTLAPEPLDDRRLSRLSSVERNSEISRAIQLTKSLINVLNREAAELRDLTLFSQELLEEAQQQLRSTKDLTRDERVLFQAEVAYRAGVSLSLTEQADAIDARVQELATLLSERERVRVAFQAADIEASLRDDPEAVRVLARRVRSLTASERAVVNAAAVNDRDDDDDSSSDFDESDIWLDDLLDRMPDFGTPQGAGSGDSEESTDPDAIDLDAGPELEAVEEAALATEFYEDFDEESKSDPVVRDRLEDARDVMDAQLNKLVQENREIDFFLQAYLVEFDPGAQSSTPNIESELQLALRGRQAISDHLNSRKQQIEAEIDEAGDEAERSRLTAQRALIEVELRANFSRLAELSDLAARLGAIPSEN